MSAVQVKVLHTSECPHWAAARDVATRVARAAGVEVEIVATPVETQAEAAELRFLGSPTVRIDGHDVESGAEALEDFGLG